MCQDDLRWPGRAIPASDGVKRLGLPDFELQHLGGAGLRAHRELRVLCRRWSSPSGCARPIAARRSAGGSAAPSRWAPASGPCIRRHAGLLAADPAGLHQAADPLSWLAAVAASGIALWVASHGALTWLRLAGGSLAMGARSARCTTSAWRRSTCRRPSSGTRRWSPRRLRSPWRPRRRRCASSSGCAGQRPPRLVYQTAAALLMGLAISGMHYTGMAAASFRPARSA